MALPVWCVPQGQHPLLRPAVLRRPSVVNIANIALARHYYSTDVLKIPQGAARMQQLASVCLAARVLPLLKACCCLHAVSQRPPRAAKLEF